MVFINCLPGHSAPTALPAEEGRHRMPNRSLATLLAALLLTLALACAGSASAAIPAGNTGWSWSNPLPQGNALDRVEVSGGRVWASGATGTLLHSDDSGATWTAVRTGLLDDIRTLEAISPTSVVFAGRCALRRSDDGGATVRRLAWGANDDSCAAQIQAVSFPSPQIGYLLLTNGDVYATGDGGENWNKRGVAPGSTSQGGTDVVRDIHFSGVSTGVLSVGNRVLHSVDAGANWTPVKAAATGAGLFNFEFLGSTVGYAIGDRTDLLKTTDSGATWSAVLGDSVPRGYDLRTLSCASETTCVASIAGNSLVLRTINAGESWTAALTGTEAVNGVGFIGGSNVVAVGQGGFSAISGDAGATWSPGSSSALGAFVGLRVDTPRSAFIFGHQGAIARSINAGGSWSLLKGPTGDTIEDVTSPGGKRIYALSEVDLLRVSDNSGVTWRTVLSGVPKSAQPEALFAWKSSTLLTITRKGLYLSTRSGSRSRLIGGKTAKLSFSAVDRTRASVIAYGRTATAITKNEGKTWKLIKRPRGAGPTKRLDMVDEKHGFLLDTKAELFQTKNAGKTWRRIETTGANVAVSMAFGDRKHGYLTDDSGRVLATADGGATWSRQYPFFDSTSKSNSLIAAPGKLSALTLVSGTNRVFGTTTGGRIGSSSQLTISPSANTAREGSVVRVTGKLTPATGTERVAVLARVVDAKGGTRWVSQERTVSATGTFTTSWKISASTAFIARWSGDASHDGDAAALKIVKLRK